MDNSGRTNPTVPERIDLSRMFTNERDHFNPYIARHIQDLGNAIGLSFNSAEYEQKFGGKSIDVLARLANTGERYVIESQMTKWDSRHFEKTLEYIETAGANGVIMIAPEFRKETLDLVSLMNRKMIEDLSIYCVEARAYVLKNEPFVLFFRAAGPAVNLSMLSAREHGYAIRPKYFVWHDSKQTVFIGSWKNVLAEVINRAVQNGVDISTFQATRENSNIITGSVVINKHGQKYVFPGDGNAEGIMVLIAAALNELETKITVALICDKEIVLPRAQDKHTSLIYRAKSDPSISCDTKNKDLASQ